MTTLTPAQIESYAYQAGFRGSALQMITAIALAESGGNPSAYNPETAAGTRPGRGSYGLTQIYLTAHPQYDPSSLSDPLYNLRAAYQVYADAGYRFTPWSTYNLGSAARYLPSVPTLSQASGGQYSSAMTSLTGGQLGAAFPGAYLQTLAPAASPILHTIATVAPGPAQQPFSLWSFLGVDPESIGFTIGGAVLILVGVIVLFVVLAKQAEPTVRSAVKTGQNLQKTAASVAAIAAA